jgi:hypothetical protein
VTVTNSYRNGITDPRRKIKPWLSDGLLSNQTPSFGAFWKAFEWKMLIPFGILCGRWIYFLAIWYILRAFVILSPFGILFREKSGNPELKPVFATKHILLFSVTAAAVGTL